MKKFSINLIEKANPNVKLSLELTFRDEDYHYTDIYQVDDFQMILKELIRLGFLNFDLISINLIYHD